MSSHRLAKDAQQHAELPMPGNYRELLQVMNILGSGEFYAKRTQLAQDSAPAFDDVRDLERSLLWSISGRSEEHANNALCAQDLKDLQKLLSLLGTESGSQNSVVVCRVNYAVQSFRGFVARIGRAFQGSTSKCVEKTKNEQEPSPDFAGRNGRQRLLHRKE